jgi:hypothetical protein
MKKISSIVLLGALSCGLMFFASCGKNVYTKGKYIDPEEVNLLSDKFIESDLQMIADTLSQALISSDVMAREKKPTVMVSLFTNGTDEHIDILSLTNKLRTNLMKSKKFTFLNERLRKKIAEEYEYQSSGYVNPETAKQKGRQIGADWLLSGHISSIRQPVGRNEIVYYKTTLEVTDLETSEIIWTDEVEIKKAFKRKKVRP